VLSEILNMAPIEEEAQSLLASIGDNEVLAYTPRFGLDGIHRTSTLVEEIYLPKEELIVNRSHGQNEVNVFTHVGPRVSNAITFDSELEPARNLRVISIPERVAESVSALAKLTEEMNRHKAVLSEFFDRLEDESDLNQRNSAHAVSSSRKPPPPPLAFTFGLGGAP